MKKLFLLALFLVILAFNVSAIAEINYHFNVNNVEIVAYDCLDSGCYSVGAFSGSFPDGTTTTNGQIRIRYPSSLATPYGYAVYYVSDGYVPMEYVATWHTYGDPTVYSTDFNIDFYQINNCYSTIDTFSVTNDAVAYQPVQVSVDASLDAVTYSAFYETQTGVGYVPPQFKDNYYSADTRVTLIVRDSNGNIVSEPLQDLTLYMSTSQNIEFTWTPITDGSYTATVTTNVTDNQCTSSMQAYSSKAFNVLPAPPTNECYTLLNSLFVRDPQTVDDDDYIVNDQLIINYTKISNYADASSALTAVQSQVTYTIKNSSGDIVFPSSTTLPQNPDTTNPTSQSFTWTPSAPGWYDVNVSGIASDASCTGLNNPTEQITEHFYVRPIPTYSLNFQVADSTSGSMISGATVTVDANTATTYENGRGTISGLLAGTYSYIITHPSYTAVSGTIEIVNVDLDVFLTMSYINRPPVITNIPDVNMDEDTIYNLLDLDDYVSDTDNDDSQLTWTATGNVNIGVSIDPTTHIVTFTPAADWTGNEVITFTVTDPASASDSDQITVSVDSINDAPVIINLPDQTLNEDTPLFDAFNLNDYASDTEMPDSALSYLIAAVSDSNCGVSIDSNDNIDIQPTLNWNGVCTVTIEVSDSVLVDTDSFVVTVNSVNDNPVVAGLPDITFQTGGSDSSVDLDNYVSDVEDADNLLSWSYSGNTNVNIAIGANNIVTFTAAGGFTGTETITFTATDTNSGSGSDSMDVTVTPISNTAPTATITAPADGSSFVQGTSVTFSGTGIDIEDGALTGSSLQWTSNLDGNIGSGTSFSTLTLSVGVHTITLTATDSGSLTGTDTITVTITSTTIDTTAPTVTINSPVAGIYTTTTILLVDITATDTNLNQVWFDYGAGNVSYLAPTTIAFADETTYTLTAYASDTFGNVGSASVTFTVNTSYYVPPPTPPSLLTQVIKPLTNIYIGHVGIPNDIASAGQDLVINLDFENDGNLDLDDVSATAVIQELGIVKKIGPFDLDKNDDTTKTIILPIPHYAEPGEYMVRITISNDKVRRVKHRVVQII